MKTKFTLTALLCLFLSIQSLFSQVYRYLPDPNFRNYLATYHGCAFDASGDSLDISQPAVTNTTAMIMISANVYDLEGIQYFTNLNTLHSDSNYITIIDHLPNSITNLMFRYNLSLDSIVYFPSSIIEIIIYPSNLRNLPPIPGNVQSINILDANLTYIPELPNTMDVIQFQNNLIDSFYNVPDTVHVLDVTNNKIKKINSPFYDCIWLHLSNNLLDSLPIILSENITTLECNDNKIQFLKQLPHSIEALFCANNKIVEIDYFPSSCSDINIRKNANLTCLPILPTNLYEIFYDSTAIECIPNYPLGAIFHPVIGTFPLCLHGIHTCPSYTTIEGTTYLDQNNDCILDTTEDKLQNITVIVEDTSGVLFHVSSFVNGIFNIDTLSDGVYFFYIDTLSLPFNITCPISGYDTIIKDSSHLSFNNRNFALNCKPNFDLAITGIHTNSIFRPAEDISINLHAGDISRMYGASCSTVPATIIFNYSGQLTYNGIIPGSIMPDTILPNHLAWNIADVSLLNFYNDIAPTFYIDSSAVSGDIICFSTAISPTSGDRIPTNNSYSQCYTVLAAYDPNYKIANPSGTITSSQEWMNYTIHFQNLGTSFAENIYIWDTIDSNLDLNTLQVVGASHNQFMKLFNSSRAVQFNFLSIHLPDSTTDEAASHGWVQYRIKPISGLTEGMQINNTAGILFDLNTPIYTNTTSNRICNSPSTITQTYTLIEGQSISVGAHSYSQTGSYTDILTNVNGCDSIVHTTIEVIAGIGESTPIKLIVYPNPANDIVQIEIEDISNVPLTILDMYGRTVYENILISNKHTIHTAFLTSGKYLIKYGAYHKKLIINH